MAYEWYKKITIKIIPDSFIKYLLKIGITANVLTMLSFVCTAVAFIMFWQGKIVWGGVFAILDWAFDYLDGRAARASGGETKFGSFLDFVTDRFRMTWLVALAFSGAISFELAITALAIEALQHLVSTYIELKDFKRVPWLLNNVHIITFGAILNLIELSVIIQVIAGTVMLLLHIITASYLNFYKEK